VLTQYGWGNRGAADGGNARPLSIQAAINRFLRETNEDPKPFAWTAELDKIIAP
jgi:hypothetical protein